MIGQTISHYRILEKLGEGGMGIVYKAQDTKLDRVVALKFLPRHLASNETEQSRFLQEAKAAAALNHPNVCSVIDIQETDDQHFIVMEYVDGRTLHDLIEGNRDTLLRVDDARAHAIQIGEALQEAHSKGIVHRDIKSENIMVNSKNQIKVMDFGLAKLRGSMRLTKASSTLGTLAYMAPEQIQGGDVDARSDIFSFGVVLFEMLTGKLPFRGEHDAAMIYSIVNEEPLSVGTVRDDVPEDIDRIIARALEKDPADRYQHVDDMVSELRRGKKKSTRVVRPESMETPSDRPAGRPKARRSMRKLLIGAGGAIVVCGIVAVILLRPTESHADRKLLVVLPFENIGTPDKEYFADGLTEEITNRLSGLSGLGVIARTSAMHYKKTVLTLRQIGSELGVGYVLQGTIRWGTSSEGVTRVRVSPVLIKVGDGTQVWSQPYEAIFSDVFKIQSDIATEVAGALGVTLASSERKSLEASQTENSEAYDLYLRGNDYLRRSYKQQDFQIAIQMFEKAVESDPKFALAYARLSEGHSAMYWFHYDHTKERLQRSKSAVDEALRLDPGLPDAHASLGYYYYWGFLDYDNALKELTLALKSRPNDSRALLGIGSVERRQGKFDLAATTMTQASEFDPRSSELAFNTAQTYALLRNYPEAERFIDRSISLTPDLTSRYVYKASFSVLWKGDTKTARTIVQQAYGIASAEGDDAVFLFRVFLDMFDGNYRGALDVVSSGPARPFDDQFQYIPKAQLFADVYGLMKRRDLERAYYDSARALVERKILEQPDDARFHSALGIAYAGLGRKADAIREGKRAVELLPISREAWRGTYRVRDLARIYVMVGEHSAAIDELVTLLSRPSDISAAWLRIDPVWAPLRENSRFQKLIASNL